MRKLMTVLLFCLTPHASNAANRISCTNSDGKHQFEIILGIKSWYGQSIITIVEKQYFENRLLTNSQNFGSDSHENVEAIDIPNMSKGCFNFGVVKANECIVSDDLPEASRKNEFAYFTTESGFSWLSRKTKGYYLEKPLLLGQISKGTLALVRSGKNSSFEETVLFDCTYSN